MTTPALGCWQRPSMQLSYSSHDSTPQEGFRRLLNSVVIYGITCHYVCLFTFGCTAVGLCRSFLCSQHAAPAEDARDRSNADGVHVGVSDIGCWEPVSSATKLELCKWSRLFGIFWSSAIRCRGPCFRHAAVARACAFLRSLGTASSMK